MDLQALILLQESDGFDRSNQRPVQKTQLLRKVAVDKAEPQKGANPPPTAQIIHLNRHVPHPAPDATDRSGNTCVPLPEPLESPLVKLERLEQELRSLRAAYAAALPAAMLATFGRSPREDFRTDAVRIHEVFEEAIALSEALIRKLPQEPDDTPA